MDLSKNSALACVAFAIFCHYSMAAESTELQGQSSDLTYVGGKGSIGIGYDSLSKIRGDAHWVMSEDVSSAWIGEGWVNGTAGGLKLNYHWSPQLALKATANQSTYKLFLAVDRNEQLDSKLTLGAGLESEYLFFGATLSSALSGRRLAGGSTTSRTTTLSDSESDGREYLYDVVTTTDTRLFERPYDYGVGLRLGRYFDQSLLRLSGGLDYEWGTDTNHQTSVSLGLEKYFANSPHSFSFNAQIYQKSGPLETTRDDQRFFIMYRYALGGTGYRAKREFRMVQATPTLVDDIASANHGGSFVASPLGLPSTSGLSESKPGITNRLVKTTATMLSDAFFVFDSDLLTTDAKKSLEPIIALLRKQAYTGNILLTGHTCDIGRAKYNLLLSERRARSVKKYLVETGGVRSDVILTEGKGSTQPRFPNLKSTRFQNRRVDLQFVTVTENLEDVEVPLVSTSITQAPLSKDTPKVPSPTVEWRREYIDSEPAWMRRALHNTLSHKQTVDVYRQEEREVRVATGEKRYINRSPSAVLDAFSVNQDTTTSLDVLSNDSDPEGNPLKIASVSIPAHGSAGIIDGKINYTPAPSFVGVDNFTYTIADDKGATSAAKVAVTVLSTNRPPVAINDAFSVSQDTVTPLDVLLNDSDPDGNPLTITAVGSAAHGSASVSGSKVVYTPIAGYVGIDTFTYTIADDKGATVSAQVTITVRSTNRAPLAKDDEFSMDQDTVAQLDVLLNDNDPDGNPFAITSVTAPSRGVASISGGKISYKPLPGFVGVDSFSYSITDDRGAIGSAVVHITVKSTNRPPIAVDDTYYVNAISPVSLSVLSNDYDPDGDTLTIVSFTQPTTGSVKLGSNGSLTFTPVGPFYSTQFSYTVVDAKGVTASARVTLIDP